MTRLRILSTTFKITRHASIFHQEATVRSYLKKYPPSASVMSPKVQRNHRKNWENISNWSKNTFESIAWKSFVKYLCWVYTTHIVHTGSPPKVLVLNVVFGKSRKTEAGRVQLAKDEGILMFINLVISCDALTGTGALHQQRESFNFNPAKC